MTKTRPILGGGRAHAAAAFALLALCLCSPAEVRAQWTTPDSSGNVNTAASVSNVGVGATSPAERLTVAGSVVATGSSAIPGSQLIITNNDTTGPWIGAHTDRAGNSTANYAASRWNAQAAGMFFQFSPATTVGSARAWTTRMAINSADGYVGLNTATPSSRLHVVSGTGSGTTLLRLDTGVAGGTAFAVGGNTSTNESSFDLSVFRAGQYASRLGVSGAGSVYLQPGGGNVGIGTTAPLQRFQIGGNTSLPTTTPDAISLGATYSSAAGSNPKLRLFDNGANVYGLGVSDHQFDFMTPSGTRYVWSVSGAEKMRLDDAGNVTVAGNITATGNISAKYQDVAEWVPSTQKLSAGTVVVLDTDKTNHVLASTKSYDTKVAGVVSDSPGVILGEGGGDKLKVATTGRVKVKADATRAAIKVGDLLVTSDVEGVAMKSVEVDLGGVKIHRPGTIIGKALEPLDRGTGEILVLLSLQ